MGFNYTHCLKCSKRFANACPTDTERLDEFTFTRQLIADPELAAEYLLLDLRQHLFMSANLSDRFP